jgi:primosomal protein N' (replication factor Y) (superfamily II helicase)
MDTTTERGAHQSILQRFAHGEADILLGTQMVAKGLDFPRVTLVGVISADTQMLLPDFRSAERTFQLLTQVAGRAGRSALRGEVIIQSRQTGHYALKHVIRHDYERFYREELRYREETLYPPFSRIVLIECRGARDADVQTVSQHIANHLRKSGRQLTLLGPSAAAIAKIQNQFRWHIIVKALRTNDSSSGNARAAVADAVQKASRLAQQKSVRIIVDVDPQGIL